MFTARQSWISFTEPLIAMFFTNFHNKTSLFAFALSMIFCSSSSLIMSAFLLLAARFIAKETNSFPTTGSGKWMINLMTYYKNIKEKKKNMRTRPKQSEYAQVNLILSSSVTKYKSVIAIKRKFEIFKRSMILGIRPHCSTCSLKL